MRSKFNLLSIVLLIVATGCHKPASQSQVERTPSKDGASNPAADGSQPNPPDDLALLQGDWIIIDAQRDGAAYPAEIGGTISIKDIVATAKTTDGTTTEYEITIDPQKDPKTIDWVTTQDGVRMTLQGLYRIEGDTLINCSPSGFNLPRPTEILTTPGDGRWVFKLNRAAIDKTR